MHLYLLPQHVQFILFKLYRYLGMGCIHTIFESEEVEMDLLRKTRFIKWSLTERPSSSSFKARKTTCNSDRSIDRWLTRGVRQYRRFRSILSPSKVLLISPRQVGSLDLSYLPTVATYNNVSKPCCYKQGSKFFSTSPSVSILTMPIETCREHFYYFVRGSMTVQVTSCLFYLDSAALLMLNQ